MIVVRRDTSDLENKLSDNFRTSGFNPSIGIANELITTASTLLATDYIDLYEHSKNLRITTAKNDYLEEYGVLLDEPRSSQSFAISRDLETTYLYITKPNGQVLLGKNIARDQVSVTIEKGTLLLDASGTPILKTLHTVELVEDQVFVKTISLQPGDVTVGIGQVKLALYDLAANDNVDSELLGDAYLAATNVNTISGGGEVADDTTYRYVLQEKAHSVNLSNDNKLNTILDNLNVKSYISEPINNSSNNIVIYLQVKNLEIEDMVIAQVQQQLKNIFPEGTDIRVRGMVKSTVMANLQISTRTVYQDTDAKEVAKNNFINILANIGSGQLINFTNILEQIKKMDPRITNISFSYLAINGRELNSPTYQSNKIEKVLAFNNTIHYK